MNKTLENWLPFDFQSGTFDKRILSHLNDEVIYEYDCSQKKWPGTHKNVMNWCIISTGYAIGWNESPSIGWSFLLKKLK